MKPLEASDWPRILRPGARIFLGSGAGIPQALVRAMLERSALLRDIELVHIHTLGPSPWIAPEHDGKLRTNTFFLTPEVAEAVRDGRADYTPCSLSEIPRLFRSTTLPLDVALVMVSPAGPDGRHSLGVSVDVVRAAVRASRIVVAQVNQHMPLTAGAGALAAEEIDFFLEHDEALPEFHWPEVDAVRARVAAYAAELIEDGSTLQVGIGVTTQAVLRALSAHRHLGIHTGMITDPMMDLIRSGAVDNSRKHFQSGLSIASHAIGSRELYRFAAEHADLHFHPSEWVNHPAIIALNHRMVAVNGARQIDLTGQVVRDSSGHEFHGGVGAQLDFLRGAAASEGGRSIHVLRSTSADGSVSRIVAALPPGTGVATSRTDVGHVVTEYGIASLRGRSIRERVLSLIQVAHPDFREDLLRDARERGWLPAFIRVAPTSLPGAETGNAGIGGGLEIRRLQLGKDGKPFFLRPLHPADMRRLQEFFYSHDEETIRMRYGYARSSMPADSAYQLVAVDQSRDLALGVFEEAGSGREPVLRAVGRYYREEDGGSAEIAFVVEENHRRLGMASVLIAALAQVAAERGIRGFHAEVLEENRAMRRLFEAFGGLGTPSHEVEGLRYQLDPAEILRRAAKREGKIPRKAKHKPAPAAAVGWFWSARCLDHDTGPGHPENPQRYQALHDSLRAAAQAIGAHPIPAGREATRRELLRCHAAHYLDLVHIDVESLADRLRTGDTAIGPESEQVARHAAGAALEAVDRVMGGELLRAFVAVRPPGHHATPDRGMGFCIYNHVALMARHAQEAHGCQKVLIVDWDVHHGNGTQDCFYADPSVFFFSTHQQGIYPHTGSAEETGAGPGAGTTLNVPLPAGSGIREILPTIESRLATAMEDFQPELVLISAGFDSRIEDPIGDFRLLDEDFATLTRAVLRIADRWAGGRCISILEGGYNPAGLASAAAAHLRALA